MYKSDQKGNGPQVPSQRLFDGRFLPNTSVHGDEPDAKGNQDHHVGPVGFMPKQPNNPCRTPQTERESLLPIWYLPTATIQDEDESHNTRNASGKELQSGEPTTIHVTKSKGIEQGDEAPDCPAHRIWISHLFLRLNIVDDISNNM